MAKLKLSSSLLWPLVILIIAFGVFYLKPWQAKTQETISVTAEGKTQVTPDIAKITATVESKNQNLDAARSQTEQKIFQQGLLTKFKFIHRKNRLPINIRQAWKLLFEISKKQIQLLPP